MGARFVVGLLVATFALVAVSVAASSAGTARFRASSAGVTRLLLLDRSVSARAAPATAARVVGVVPAWTPLTRSRMTLPVVESLLRPGGGRWVRVRLPMRPNGATGWVPADAGSVGSTRWQIVIHRSERRAVVLEAGKVRATFRVVVGKPSTPTPLGTFFVVEKVHVGTGVLEGPWALATSAYSDVLHEFGGGQGEIALHGTAGLSDALGTASSHGCVRFAPAAISRIANEVGPGTPVIVTR
jgi:lipoprotein-anchoring transpeptidase ErfK/SrfK